MVHGNMLFVSLDGKSGKLMEVSIPHSPALDLLNKAKAQSDLFILKKGAEVSLDLTAVPAQYRGDVEQSLKQLLDQKGFQFSDAASVSLKATISGPTSEAISYHFAGNFVVQQYKSALSIEYDGKSIWSSGATNVPGMISGRDAEAIKKQLADAGRKPNLRFFSSARLPDYLQKPSGDGPGKNSQMLGVSKFTKSGMVD